EDPPTPYEDIEALKQQVEMTIRTNNPALLATNCSAADIIARCLRYSHRGRVESAAKLLRDINTFDAPMVSANVSREVQTLLKRSRALDRSGQSLLSWMAVLQVRE